LWVKTKLQEIKITNSSGIFSSSIKSLEDWIGAGVDGIVLKTATYEPRDGYEPPNVAIEKERLVQAMGLPNPGYEKMGERAKKMKKKHPEVFIIASFTTGDKKELIRMVNCLKYADALEYNISCPHAKGLGSSIGYDFEILEVMCSILKNCGKPFGLKMPYYPTDEMLKKCVDVSNADFYTNINSVGKAMMIGKDFGISNRLGGLSGPAIKPLAVGQVYRTRKLTDKIIFGCGGVVDRRDVAEFLKAGANGVQLGSGVLFHKSKKNFVKEAKQGFCYELENYFQNKSKEVFE